MMHEVEWQGVTYAIGEMTYGDALEIAAHIRRLPEDDLKNDAAVYMHIQSAFILKAPITVVKVAPDAQRVEPPRTPTALNAAPVSLVSALGAAAVKANASAFSILWDFLLVARGVTSAPSDAATPSES